MLSQFLRARTAAFGALLLLGCSGSSTTSHQSSTLTPPVHTATPTAAHTPTPVIRPVTPTPPVNTAAPSGPRTPPAPPTSAAAPPAAPVKVTAEKLAQHLIDTDNKAYLSDYFGKPIEIRGVVDKVVEKDGKVT